MQMISLHLPLVVAWAKNLSLFGMQCISGGEVKSTGFTTDVWCLNASLQVDESEWNWVSMPSLNQKRGYHSVLTFSLDPAPTSAPTTAPTTTPTPPTILPTTSPSWSPTTPQPSRPTSSPMTLTPTSQPSSPPTIAPSRRPTPSPLTSTPTSSPLISAPTSSPTRSPTSSSGKESKLTSGDIAGIVIPLLLLLLAGVIFCFYHRKRKQISAKQAFKIQGESREGPKDPRHVALDGTAKLCEVELAKPKISVQTKLFLQSVIAGAKEDQNILAQLRSSEVEMNDLILAEPQGMKVFNMDEFEHVKFLSQGEGGTAELYKEKSTNKEVVIKVPHHVEELAAECKVWCSIGLHPNVARMIGVVHLNDKPRGIVMEYYPGGSLNSTAHEFSPNELLRIAIDLARGLQCLHAHKVIHRDLAARNILMARDRRVAITDFGMSRQLDENDTYRMMSDAKLPWRTLAPELLLMEDGSRVFTEKTDIWALGVTLWELATKRSAYAEYAEKDVFTVLKQKIGNGVVKLDLTPIVMNHQHLAAALVGCLNRDPALRPTVQQLRWLLKDDNSAEVTDRAVYIAAVQGGEYA